MTATSDTGRTVDLGEYKLGEIPRSLAVTFTDKATGAVLDISSGFTASAFKRAHTDAEADAVALPAPTISGSVVTVPFGTVGCDTEGAFYLEVWVGSAANATRIASQTFTYLVTPSVAAAPSF